MPGSTRASSVISSRRSSGPSNKAGKQGRQTRPANKAGKQGRQTRPANKAGKQGRQTRPANKAGKRQTGAEAQQFRASGLPDAWLADTSPLSWEHISFSGDFLWERAAATADERRPLNLD
jgi:hypothetical protein